MDNASQEIFHRLRRARFLWRSKRLAAGLICAAGAVSAVFFLLLAAELLYQPTPEVCGWLTCGGVFAIILAVAALLYFAVGRITLRETARSIESSAPALGRQLECALDLVRSLYAGKHSAAADVSAQLSVAALAQTAAAYRPVSFTASLNIGGYRRFILPSLILLLFVGIGLQFASVRASWQRLLWPAVYTRPQPVDILAPTAEPENTPPVITAVEVKIRPPAYTGLGETFLRNASVIRAPLGSDIAIGVFTDHPVKEATGHLSGGLSFPLKERSANNQDADKAQGAAAKEQKKITGDGALRGGFTAAVSGNLTFSLLDNEGRSNASATAYPLEVIPDNKPQVRFVQPAKNRSAAPGDTLDFVIAAADDYGLGMVRLFFKRNRRGEPQSACVWRDVKSKDILLQHTFVFAPDSFQGGDTVTFYAEANDRAPGEKDARVTRSAPLIVTIIDPKTVQTERRKTLAAILQQLAVIHQGQVAAHRETGTLRLAASDLQAAVGRLSSAQTNVRKGILEVLQTMKTLEESAAGRISVVLQGLANNELPTVAANLQALAQAGTVAERSEALRQILPAQVEVIKRLAQILGIVTQMAALPTDLSKDGADLPQNAADGLKKLQEALAGLKDTQKKVISLTETWDKENVDDFTAGEKAAAEELKAAEENWANMLRDIHSDLNKLPPQDFSNPSLLGEVMTVLEEVEMIASSLTAKETVISTTAAETAVELAESLTTHVEKWLMDKADHTAWKMEEPLSDYDTPMAELPDKLEDIVGELVEQEEELMEEAEDQSSSWADSLDKGAGWDAADGPMSNYSAQGVTGNQLPNDTEVGGRSGQGRSGKSHGEMVGDTAIDKGGRKTPARLTPDAFEKGNIKDQSTEASGGATGGGKGGGAGAQGLEGPAAPKNPNETMPRLQGKQAELRSKAERINLQLKLRGYNTEMLENTLNELRTAENSSGGRYAASGRAQRRLADSLRTTVDSLAAQARTRADYGANLPRDLQREILNARSDDFPAGYEDLVKSYYEKLSGGE